jgi:hypothetical protein
MAERGNDRGLMAEEMRGEGMKRVAEEYDTEKTEKI